MRRRNLETPQSTAIRLLLARPLHFFGSDEAISSDSVKPPLRRAIAVLRDSGLPSVTEIYINACELRHARDAAVYARSLFRKDIATRR
jgi:hypothetical protein